MAARSPFIGLAVVQAGQAVGFGVLPAARGSSSHNPLHYTSSDVTTGAIANDNSIVS